MPAPLPLLKLITLSSTIAGQGKDSLDGTRYNFRFSGRPQLTAAELIERVPELARFARVEPDLDLAHVEPRPPDRHWPPLAARVNELLASPEVSGVVVGHGTNTLEETAYFLHLTVASTKPVVLVGAQRPITHLSSDGPLNLVGAARVAASPEAAGKGVLLAMNGTIHSARDVTKTNTYRVETFQSPGLGPIGYVDPDRVVFYRAPLRPHTAESPFRVTADQTLPRVDILYQYAGDDGELAKAAVGLGARGLVIACAGAGALGGMKDALRDARDRGVVVVRSSRVGSGRVLADDHYTEPGFVAADDLNPQKARVLLSLALVRTRDPGEIQRLFDTY